MLNALGGSVLGSSPHGSKANRARGRIEHHNEGLPLRLQAGRLLNNLPAGRGHYPGGAWLMIREGLAGKRIALSGVTGFLGTALLERLLTDTDVARIDAIARGDAHSRVAGLLTGAAFGPARDRIGGERLWEMFQRRVRPLQADLMEAAPALDEEVDPRIHSAGT